MAKRPGIWAWGIAFGMIGAGVAVSNGCDNTEYINEGIPFGEFPPLMTDALCTSVDNCYTQGLTLRDQCRARTGPIVELGLGPAIGAGISSGRIEYYSQSASDCLSALAACGRDQQLPAICFDTFVGQVPLGGDCQYPLDCAGDAYCHAAAMCPGTCTAWGAVGDACATDGDCDRNLRCKASLCTATGGQNAACGSNGDCNYDLLCLTVDGAGKCVEATDYTTAAEGEPCGTFTTGLPTAPLCQVEFVCAQDDAGSTTGTCEKVVGAGDACSLAFLSQCPQGYTCSDTPGVCEALPTSGPCEELYGSPICNAGYACEDGQCVEQLENGAECSSRADCLGSGCVGGTCGALFVCDPG